MSLEFQLAQLETAQLVHAVGPSDFLFKNSLTQETVYASLLKNTRREIHAQVARTYEELYTDRLDEFAAPLAQHYAEAGNDAKTLEYSVRAGDAAARLYANTEAILHYSRALEIAKRIGAPDVASLQNLYLKRGRALELCGRYEDAVANYIEMAEYARTCKNHTMELAALMARATVHSTFTAKYDPMQAGYLCDQALALATELDDQTAAAKILWNLMLLEMAIGHFQESIIFGERSLALARQLDLRDQLAYTLNDISRAYAITGQAPQALAALAESRDHWRATNNLPMLADNLTNTALSYFIQSDYAKTIAQAQEALHVSRAISNRWGESYALEIMGYAALEQGNFILAIDALEEAIRLGDEIGFLHAIFSGRAYLAYVYANLGVPKRAVDILNAALLRLRQLKNDMGTLLPTALQAYLHFYCDEFEQAEAIIRRADLSSVSINFGSATPMFLLFIDADLALKKGEYARSIAAMDKMIAILKEINFHFFLPDAYLLKSRALVAQNQLASAQQILEQAFTVAQNSPRILWQVLAAQAALTAQHDQARELLAQAREILKGVVAGTPAKFRESFLNLPHVRAVWTED
jgi:tetratricopeptide (TPR) repeat protein